MVIFRPQSRGVFTPTAICYMHSRCLWTEVQCVSNGNLDRMLIGHDEALDRENPLVFWWAVFCCRIKRRAVGDFAPILFAKSFVG